MKNTSDLHRLLKILTLVQGTIPMTPKELERQLEVGSRTVFRDLKKLRATGIGIEFDRKAKRFIVSGNSLLQPLQLTAEEALALSALCTDVAGSEQIAFTRPAYQALQKIRAQLPDDLRKEVDEAAAHVVIRTEKAASGDGHADVYDRMQRAIALRTSVTCEYETPGKMGYGPFGFEPYALFFAVRAWYAVGFHQQRKAVRMMKLGRFSRVTPTENPYEIPEKFSLDKFLGNAWRMIPGTPEHDVELVFSAPFAETISETNWHRTQDVQENADGTTTFRCKVSGLDEIVWWVLGMGPSCRVVKPEALRARIRGLAAGVSALYPDDAAMIPESVPKAKPVKRTPSRARS